MRDGDPLAPSRLVRVAAGIALACIVVLGVSQAPWAEASDASDRIGSSDSSDPAARIIADGICPCGCGNSLPGSGRATACFGCSVGKAEVTFIRESLASGRPLGEILMALRELVLVEVFADYTDPKLPEVWKRASRVADELGQHRVVLRAPALDDPAIRALVIAECARGSGRFSRLQGALIAHTGPWDEASVIEMAVGALHHVDSERGQEWTRESVRQCVARSDLSAQVERDRSHASQRAMLSFPAVSVNGERVEATQEAMRRAIRAALQKGSI